MKWISVKERWPTEDESKKEILITVHGDLDLGILSGPFCGEDYHWQGCHYKYLDKAQRTITHWMVAPEPAKEEPAKRNTGCNLCAARRVNPGPVDCMCCGFSRKD